MPFKDRFQLLQGLLKFVDENVHDFQNSFKNTNERVINTEENPQHIP